MEPDRWLGIELRHLLALEAVAREGSFGKAATSLGYTQSAVSQQIAMLERIVGQRLIERPGGPRPVSLTEAGRLLLTHAEAIAARLAAAQADLGALGDGEAGMLRVGVFQSVGQRILPELMRRFMEAWPKVDVTLTESADDGRLLGLVERGELDLSFVELPVPQGPFETVRLLNDPYIIVVRADSAFALAGRPAGLTDLSQLQLIGHLHSRGLTRVESHLQELGVELNFVVRSDVNATVQALVVAGVGAAIAPRLAIDPDDERTAIVELDPAIAVPARVLAIAWHRNRSLQASACDFVTAAETVCAELELRSFFTQREQPGPRSALETAGVVVQAPG